MCTPLSQAVPLSLSLTTVFRRSPKMRRMYLCEINGSVLANPEVLLAMVELTELMAVILLVSENKSAFFSSAA